MEKAKKITGTIFGLFLVTLVTYWTTSRLSLLTGFPKGVDAYAHLTRALWILTRFPQIQWNPSWDSGTYFWLWSYPPSGSILTALVIRFFSISAEQALNYTAFASFLLFVFSFYWILSSWSGPWLAIPVALMAITTPALWSWWGHGGNYIRIWGLGFYTLSIALFIHYLKNQNKRNYVFLVLCLGFTLSTHMLFAGLILASLGGYLLFAVAGWKNKFFTFLKTFGVAFLLVGFWYLPMMTSTKGGRFIEFVVGEPVAFKAFLGINPAYPYFSLPPGFTILIFLTLGLALFVIFWKRKKTDLRVWGIVPPFLIGILVSLIYPLLGNFSWYPEKGYIAVFAPFAMFPLIIIFSCILLAGVLGTLWGKWKNTFRAIGISLLASALILLFFAQTDFSRFAIYDVSSPESAQSLAIPPIKSLGHQKDYRFGTDSAFVADWFNYLYPDLPQTRDYIYQGIPYKRWQYFQEYVIWTQEDRYPETEWILDWYGVKYFTVGFASFRTKFDKFLKRNDLFLTKHSDERNHFYIFEYREARPILASSDATPILVFGSENDFETLVRDFALLNWGSDIAIPVYGGKDLPNKSSDQLDLFPVIFLYRYYPQDGSAEANLIQEYLQRGGRVLIEARPEPKPQVWPSWVPVEESQLLEVVGDWNFSHFSGALEGFSEEDFSPPAFGDTPWKVSRGLPREQTEVWLTTKNQPVIVYKKVDQGEVIWSSLNLPYHGESYRNELEISLLGKLLGFSSESRGWQAVQIEKNQAEKRIWVVKEKAKGLVWKESWFPRWTIWWEDSQGQKGEIHSYLAGPSLSYIPLPQKATYPLTIKASYRLVLNDILGWLVTVVTLLFLLVYMLEGKLFPPVITNWKKHFSGKISSWWGKEEEV